MEAKLKNMSKFDQQHKTLCLCLTLKLQNTTILWRLLFFHKVIALLLKV